MARFIDKGLSFDDVLLTPQASDVLPNEVSLKTRITKSITLNVPILSAAMDTVTEHRMAIAMANYGGAGVIHKNMSIEAQAEEINKVKSHTVDLEANPQANLDAKGRLIVGGGVGATKDVETRAGALIEAGVDFLIIDSAHGHSANVIQAVKTLKKTFNIDIIAGNVATGAGTLALIEAGADGVKVGIGPGSICTTRVVSGVGVPQITAIVSAVEVANAHNIPVIGDGGIKVSGDITKAIAAGSSAVMLGSLLAGHAQAPAEIIEKDGRKYMAYRGMGSEGAMGMGSSDRYGQVESKKFVPEGIEALTPLKGYVEDTLFTLLGGLRSGMGYCGRKTIEELRLNGEFIIITSAGMAESRPHSVVAR